MSAALNAVGVWFVGLGAFAVLAVAFILIMWLLFSEEGQELICGVTFVACVVTFPVMLIWGVYQIGKAVLGAA